MRSFGPLVDGSLDGIDGNEVHHRELSLDEIRQTLDFGFGVIDARHQRPFDLQGVLAHGRIVGGLLKQRFNQDGARMRQQPAALFIVGRMQRQRKRGLDARGFKRCEKPLVAHRGDHELLVLKLRHVGEKVDCGHHRAQVVARLPHAHEDDLLQIGPHASGGNDLRDDLGA